MSKIADLIVRDVAELDYSGGGFNEERMMSVTDDDLRLIVERHVAATSTKPADGVAEAGDVKTWQERTSIPMPEPHEMLFSMRQIHAAKDAEIADLRSQLARQQAPVGDSVDTPEPFGYLIDMGGALGERFVKADELAPEHAMRAECATALYTHAQAQGEPVALEPKCEVCKDTGIVYTGPIGDPPEQCDACFDQEPAAQADEVRDAALEDRDMMLWLSDDNEVYANGPEDFANDYASNCLNVGEEAEVGVDCAHRLPSRTMRIALVAKEGDQDDSEVVWKWVERTTAADNQKGGE